MPRARFLPIILLLVVTATLAQIYKWVDEQGGVHFGDRPPEDADAEDVELPEGPSQETISKAQEELRKHLEARDATEAAGAGEDERAANGEAERAGNDVQAGFAVEKRIHCFAPLSDFVADESAIRFASIAATQLTGSQQDSLRGLFEQLEGRWRGDKTEVSCAGHPARPDRKSSEFYADGELNWDSRQSQLAIEISTTGKDDRGNEELVFRYKVGDALYFSDRKSESEDWFDMTVKGNQVELLESERNAFAFLVKRRTAKNRSVERSEIHRLEWTGNRLLIRIIYFTNEVLSGWQTLALSK